MVIYRRKYIHLFTRNIHMCYQSMCTTITWFKLDWGYKWVFSTSFINLTHNNMIWSIMTCSHTLSSTIYTYVTPIFLIWKKNHFHDVQSVHSAYIVALTQGLLTRHLGHLKPPRTFLTRHLFIDGHLLPNAIYHISQFIACFYLDKNT